MANDLSRKPEAMINISVFIRSDYTNRARLSNLTEPTQEDGTTHYSFSFPGFIFTYSSCDLQVRDEIVMSKELIQHND